MIWDMSMYCFQTSIIWWVLYTTQHSITATSKLIIEPLNWIELATLNWIEHTEMNWMLVKLRRYTMAQTHVDRWLTSSEAAIDVSPRVHHLISTEAISNHGLKPRILSALMSYPISFLDCGMTKRIEYISCILSFYIILLLLYCCY